MFTKHSLVKTIHVVPQTTSEIVSNPTRIDGKLCAFLRKGDYVFSCVDLEKHYKVVTHVTTCEKGCCKKYPKGFLK